MEYRKERVQAGPQTKDTMEFAINVSAGVLAGIFLSGVAFGWRRFRLFFQFGAIRRVWAPFLDRKTAVILTGRKGPLPRSSTKVSFLEVQAAQRLKSFFGQFGANFECHNSCDSPQDHQHDKHLIFLGSQTANVATQTASRMLDIQISYDKEGNLVYNTKTFASTPSDGEPLREDYALIVKCDSPYGHAKKALILAGNHAAATLAAAEYMTSSDGIALIAKEIGYSDFVAVLHVTIENNVPKRLELMKCVKHSCVMQT